MSNHSATTPAAVDMTDQVIRACENRWEAHKQDCSGFVRAVAADLDVPLSGLANQLVESMAASPEWRDLGNSANQAMNYAGNGYLVVAGLSVPGHHGHVAIVVRANSSVPIAYWGRLGGVGRKHTSIHWSWNATDLPHVRYFARPVAPTAAS